MLRPIFLTCIFCVLLTLVNGVIPFNVGVILKKEEENKWQVVEQVLTSERITDRSNKPDIRLFKEVVDTEDTINYFQAFCRLLEKGIDALISSTASPHYPVLSAYAHEYRIPLLSPDLPQEIWHYSTNFSYGIKPISARPMLKLFQQYGWHDIIYLYDNDDGPENLNLIFTVGRPVIDLSLDGILRVNSAVEANQYLRYLDKSFKSKDFHVVLDTDSQMAREILWLHVNDVHVRKKNFHFLYPRPTLEDFWIPQMASFGAINVTTFLIQNQLPEAEDIMRHLVKEPGKNFDISLYYYYDAALILKATMSQQFWRLYRLRPRILPETQEKVSPTCMNSTPNASVKGSSLNRMIREITINGTTGPISFHNGKRLHFNLNITEVRPQGFQRIAYWAYGNLHPEAPFRRSLPTALPLIQGNTKLHIVTTIHPPYMMLKNKGNVSFREPNDQFEGYCKDLLDLLAQEMSFEYDLHLVEEYGRYDKSRGKWSGIIGELIQGKADIAVADLRITGQRQRVVEFTDPYELVGLSLVMKNPRFVSNVDRVIFFLSAFTVDVWICIIFSVILFCILFHFITKFTGAPDSIESASGIWGRKHTAIVNIWFAIGTSMFQGTGVYPRSISSRILCGFCWFFTLMLSSLFIASITAQISNSRLTDEKNPQLAQLKSLSLESIISESASRGWPKIGLVQQSTAEMFVKKSSIPVFTKFNKYLENNPSVTVTSAEEGLERVRKSSGNYAVLLESLIADYAIRRKPCDVIATHDSVHYAGYGLATPLGSPLMFTLNNYLHIIQEKGALGDLHRKWWIDSSECKNIIDLDKEEITIHVFSGLLCVSAIGILIVLGVFGVQYVRRNQNKESRRQQLSFEDMNLGQTLPTPPPELLAEPPPVLNLPEYDKKTLL